VATALLAAISLQPFNMVSAHAPHPILFGHHFTPPPPPPPGPPTLKAVPTVNVKDFGAKGDGTTDDTTSINNAVANAKSTHKVVLFPAGTFYHAGTLTFDSVAVTGVGPTSVLKANPGNEENTALILTGTSASITNMVVSTQGVVDGDDSFPEATEGNIVVQNATSFTVQHVTLIQGQNETGIFITGSNGGYCDSVDVNGYGTGAAPDTGVWIDNSQFVTVSNSLFQNQNDGIRMTHENGPTSSISILSNTIGTTTPNFGIRLAGINGDGVTGVGMLKNTIQMANDNNGTYAAYFNNCNSVVFSQNTTSGGNLGVYLTGTGSGANSVTLNTIRGCGSAGVNVNSTTPTILAIVQNKFGECGLTDNSASSAVILATGSAVNLASVTVTNNSYQGHANGLKFEVNGANLAAANISGNTQTQTNLPGNPKN
jgi:hypothetical protein